MICEAVMLCVLSCLALASVLCYAICAFVCVCVTEGAVSVYAAHCALVRECLGTILCEGLCVTVHMS